MAKEKIPTRGKISGELFYDPLYRYIIKINQNISAKHYIDIRLCNNPVQVQQISMDKIDNGAKDITDLKYFDKLAPLCASPREFRGAISRDLMAPETVRRRAVR